MARLLRAAMTGSIGGGKSTLITCLLHDAEAVTQEQPPVTAAADEARDEAGPDLTLPADVLRAEWERRATVDVVHRHVATPRRRFVIADTPGQVSHVGSMITGGSVVDVAIVLVDVSRGVSEQARLYAALASLIGIRHLVVGVNKMDLVDYRMEPFEEICVDFGRFAARLDADSVRYIPLSALNGENVVRDGSSMTWYQGPSLLPLLEELPLRSEQDVGGLRFPVRHVVRRRSIEDDASRASRGYIGTVAGGVLRAGDRVTALPSGRTTNITGLWWPGAGGTDEARPGQVVMIETADDLDLSCGDIVCGPQDRPHVGREFDATLCWTDAESALAVGDRFLLQHTTRSVQVEVRSLDHRLDIATMRPDTEATALHSDEIGRVRLRTRQPLLFDSHRVNRATGRFVLADDATGRAVAAGMIVGPVGSDSAVVWHGTAVRAADRATAGATVWFTGLPASGKSSIGVEIERRLVSSGRPAYLLDGDNLRHGLTADLGFSEADRMENVRRVGEVAKLLADAGVVAIVSLISPYATGRAAVRAAHVSAGVPFFEVFVDTPLSVCEQRDPKGLYVRARAGMVRDFTGIDAPYEAPDEPDLRLCPEDGDAGVQAGLVLELLSGGE